MEERLRGFFPDASIEVVVGAVGGYSSNDALDWYDDFLHKLNPDVAIVHLGWNDMGQFHPFGLRYKNENLAYQGRTVLGTMMENLYFLRIPYVAIGRWERSRPVDTSPLTTEESRVLDEFAPRHFETNLETLVRKLKDRGSVVYLVVCAGLITYPPTPDELRRMHFPRGMKKKLAIYKSVYVKYTESLERVAGITRTPLIDLRELIRGAEERRIFTDTVHIDTEGAERFGNYMADAIRPGVREIRARKAGSLGSLAH